MGLYGDIWGYIGMTEQKMETTMVYWVLWKLLFKV